MNPFEKGMRELVADLVRDEVKRVLAVATTRDEYLTTGAAAELAKVATGTIRRWIREGRLVGHRAGSRVRVCRAELERLLRDGARSDGDLTPEELALRDFG